MWDRLFITQFSKPFQQMTSSTQHTYLSNPASPKITARNRLCRFPYTSMIVLTLLLLTLLLADFQSVDAFVRPSGKAGLLKLCPPGGESFATAWQITCGMRRRKKRETELDQDSIAVTTLIPSTSSQTNSSKTNVDEGAVDSVQAIAGAALTNPEPLLKSSPVDSLPSGQGTIRKRSAWANELLQYDPVSHMGNNPAQQAAKEEALYRAPSMTEMMQVCCRYGCSLRDLLPYCDPFGEWDS